MRVLTGRQRHRAVRHRAVRRRVVSLFPDPPIHPGDPLGIDTGDCGPAPWAYDVLHGLSRTEQRRRVDPGMRQSARLSVELT